MNLWIRSLLALVVGVLLLNGAVSPSMHSVAQDTPSLVYEHFDTELTLNEAGVLHVRMVQQIRFADTYSQAFFAIPKRHTTAIENIQLWEATSDLAAEDAATDDLQPLQPDLVEETDGEIILEWSYAPTTAGDVRLFVLEYDAIGALWVYPDHIILDWAAVNADRSGLAVEESVVTLELPPSISVDEATVISNLTDAAIVAAGNMVTLTAAAPIPDGTPFTVQAYLPPDAGALGVQDWQRAYDSENLRVVATDFTSDLTVENSGQLQVREVTTAEVAVGTLHQGFQRLSLQYVDGVEIQSVSLNGQPLVPSPGECAGCYVVDVQTTDPDWVYVDPSTDQLTIDETLFGEVTVDWYATAPIMAGDTFTLALEYSVTGAWRVSPDDQFMTRQVVPDWGMPVEHAALNLTLPDGVTLDEVLFEGPPEQGSPQLQSDGSLLFSYDGPVVPNAWMIALTIPAGATQATPPMWQTQFEATQAQADAATVARARRSLVEGVILALAGVGALLLGIVWWMRKGRKRTRELLGGYISEPPSPLSPAIVSYLVDRKASEQGILGAIFHMASMGLVEIDSEDALRLRRLRREAVGPAVNLKDVHGNIFPLSLHLRTLFDQVILPHVPEDDWVALDTLVTPLQTKLPEIYAALGRDVQQYFIAIPGSRGNSIPSILWILTYASLMLLTFFEILPVLATFIIGFVALLAFVGWSALRESAIGGYSDRGAQEADRWRKFKTYLLDIERYGDQGAAQAILDRYFGYVVAFGIQEVVLAHAARLGSLRPLWMPSDSHEPDTGAQEQEPQSRESTSRPPGPWTSPRWPTPRRVQPPTTLPGRPTLASMSVKLGSSLERASQSLAQVLATAAGDPGAAGRSVLLESQLRRREMTWDAGTPVNRMLDDIMRQSVADAREIQASRSGAPSAN